MIQQFYSWAYIRRKTWFERIHVPQHSFQHYLQQPRHGNNLNVHRQMNGYRRCSACILWNITQPLKKMKQCHLQNIEQSSLFLVPRATSKPLLVMCFNYGSVYTSLQNCQCIPPSPMPPTLVTVNLFSKSESLFLLCK